MKKINFENLIEESVVNIRDDRQEVKNLLNDLIHWMAQGQDRHKEVGFTIAKYVETLQRSNEQLVKISTLLKRKDSVDENISDSDRESIFDELNSSVFKKKSPEKGKK